MIASRKGRAERGSDCSTMVYRPRNGAECRSWPDGGSTPFKAEKDTNWEGAFRVPCLVRWPGLIKPGTVGDDMCAHQDCIPSLAAAAGEPNLVERLKKGTALNGKSLGGAPRRSQLAGFLER